MDKPHAGRPHVQTVVRERFQSERRGVIGIGPRQTGSAATLLRSGKPVELRGVIHQDAVARPLATRPDGRAASL